MPHWLIAKLSTYCKYNKIDSSNKTEQKLYNMYKNCTLGE